MNLDDGINLSDIVFLLVFFVCIFVIPSLLVWASYSSSGPLEQFDIRELWIYGDKIDPYRVIVLGTWWVHTSSMIMWTLLRTIQTQDYVTYMLWGTIILGKMLVSSKSEEPKPTTNTNHTY